MRIRNKAGILTIKIIRELHRRDIFRCLGDDRLPSMAQPRLEVHKNKHNETTVITLCDNKSDGPPYDVYLVELGAYDDYPSIYFGQFENTEQPDDVFETMEG